MALRTEGQHLGRLEARTGLQSEMTLAFGALSLAVDRSVCRAGPALAMLHVRNGLRPSRASVPTLLLLVLTRFSRQFPLLSCLMVVGLWHDALSLNVGVLLD